MPLTEKVSFRDRLQRGNGIQVSKIVRWQFKMEPDQALKIDLNVVNVFSAGSSSTERWARTGAF